MTFQPYVRAPSKSKEKEKEKDLAPRRIILLVEDEPFVREATCGILESAGFEVLPAEDAPQALKIYDECQQYHYPRQIALVMTDMILPSGTGQHLAEDLRQRSHNQAVLVTSGYPNPDFETESQESHLYFLPKPYSKRTLCEKINQILAPKPQAAQQAS
ncbi:MAG TPA: response regulator [Terriglobales bacterium]|jgi:CheY-like chemotaxis protein|nr:response regulator [Terriglobales bacterium]